MPQDLALDFKENASYDIMEAIVNFCYCGDLHVSEFPRDKVLEIRRLADYLCIDLIVHTCTGYLLKEDYSVCLESFLEDCSAGGSNNRK